MNIKQSSPILNTKSQNENWYAEFANAFSIKDILKMHGLKWDSEKKVWMTPTAISSSDLLAICTEVGINPPKEVVERLSDTFRDEPSNNTYTNSEGDTFVA